MARRTLQDRRADWRHSLQGNIDSVYRAAVHGHWTHTRILAELGDHLYRHVRYGRLTIRDREYLRGYTFAHAHVISERHLVWRLGPASGPCAEDVQGTWNETTPFSELCRIPGALYGAHFWRGTDQPFGEYKPTN